jgi:hypothetical protein
MLVENCNFLLNVTVLFKLEYYQLEQILEPSSLCRETEPLAISQIFSPLLP